MSQLDIRIEVVGQFQETSAWNRAMLQSLSRVQETRSKDIDFSWNFHGDVKHENCTAVFERLIDDRQPDIIWAHNGYAGYIKPIHASYADVAWAVSGGCGFPIGGNAFWFITPGYESAFLLGMVAGRLTKTNVVGVLGFYAFGHQETIANAFISGAKHVNPSCQSCTTHVESWHDDKAEPAVANLASMGVDMLFSLLTPIEPGPFAVFEACREQGLLAFGNCCDLHEIAPDVVVSSSIIRWDPAIETVIDAVKRKKEKGVPYDAPKAAIAHNRMVGASQIADFHGFADRISSDLQDELASTAAQIDEGTFEFPFQPQLVCSLDDYLSEMGHVYHAGEK